MAFAPLACNSFGQQGPDLLRYQWLVADRAARRVVSVPSFSLPATAKLVLRSLAQTFKRLRQNFYRQSTQEVLVANLEGVCERVFGRIHAMQSHPQDPEFVRLLSIPLRSSFLSSVAQDPVPVSPSPPHSPLVPSRLSRCPGTPSSCHSPSSSSVYPSEVLLPFLAHAVAVSVCPLPVLTDLVSSHPPVRRSSRISTRLPFVADAVPVLSPHPPCSPSSQRQRQGSSRSPRPACRGPPAPRRGRPLSSGRRSPCLHGLRLGCLGSPLSELLRLLPGL